MEIKKANSHKAMYLLLLLQSFVYFKAQATLEVHSGKNDSLKNKYTINDPRNPDCPCHIYEKKAQREYKKLLKHQGKQTAFVLPGKAELHAVKKENNFISRHPRSVIKRNHKAPSFNRSRKRSKKGLFQFFKKTISDCPF